jgi:hypothetical protein
MHMQSNYKFNFKFQNIFAYLKIQLDKDDPKRIVHSHI